jgi:signal transduction histidine kinase/ligand-binding sensor domain-containing protein
MGLTLQHKTIFSRQASALALLDSVFVLVFLMFPSVVSAQSLRVQRLTINDGLSQNLVYCILQDRQGFMWFGTKDGLNRYDGYRFTVFRHNPLDSKTLSGNYVTALYEDRRRMLWVATYPYGLNRFNPQTETFTRFVHNPDDSSTLSHPQVTALCEGKTGELWVGTKRGLNIIDPLTEQVRRIPPFADFEINDLYVDDGGLVWIASGRGIHFYNPSAGTVSRVLERHPWLRLHHLSLAAKFAKADHLWILAENSLYRISFQDQRIDSFSVRSPQGNRLDAVNIFADEGGWLWILTKEFALFKFNPATNQTVRVDVPSAVLSMMVDRSGVLWLGTPGEGLLKHSPRMGRFVFYPSKIRDVLYAQVMRALKGRSVLDPSTYYTSERSFARDHDGTLWVGSLRGYLYQYRGSGSDALRLMDSTLNYLSMLYVDRSGSLWAGVQNGIARYNRQQKRFEYHELFTDRQSPAGLWMTTGSLTITSMIRQDNGVFWVGTSNRGLIRYDPETRQKQFYSAQPQDSTSLSSNFVLTIAEDPQFPDRYLWVGTDGGGLNRLDIETGEFIHFTEKNVLPNNVIYGILPDRQGNLWFSTNNGLCRFNTRTFALRRFDVHDGLQSNEFNRMEYAATPDGQLWFGGTSGCNAFFPEDINDNPIPPPVVLTDLRLFNRPVAFGPSHSFLRRPITFSDTLMLDYRQNMITFEFAALDFSAPSKNQYAYRMEGFDHDWIYAGTERTATYTNLDPGTYLFRVRGTNSDGVWNEGGTSITVIVTPPYWMTWWFRGLVVVSVLFLATIAVRSRFGRLRREQQLQQQFSRQLLKQQEEDRARIAAELHDSLGQDLLVVKNRAVLGSQSVEVGSSAADHFESISSIISDSLKEVRTIAHNLRPYQLDSLGLTEALRSIVKKVGESTTLKVSAQIDDLEGVFPRDREIDVFRIVQECLNNILKHSEATEASVAVERRGEQVAIAVRDNGKGIGQKNAKGFGLMGITERVRILNGTFAIETEAGKGTSVIITLPAQTTNRKEPLR